MRKSVYYLTVFLFAACAPSAERVVVLSDTPCFRVSGEKECMVRRGQVLLLAGESRRANNGRTTRDLVLAFVPGRKERVWVAEREILPGGVVERRLLRGFFTNVYLVRDRAAYTFPVPDAPAGVTVPAGGGLIVSARRKRWYRVHWADRFLWIRRPEFAIRPFYPVITRTNGASGPVKIESSPWHIPGFGEERRYAPDRLLETGPAAAWMCAGRGPGARITFSWKRPLTFRLRLTGGYSFSRYSRNLYNRLRRCRITADGRSAEFTLPDSPSPFSFPGTWSGRGFRLEILDVYPGSERDRLVLQHLGIIPR